METKLKKLVLEGFYHEAENLMLTIPLNAQRDIIMDLAYDTESIAIYGFLRYMLEKNKTKYLLEMTIDVMINPLCFVEGAYEVALFHTRELLKIDFSVETMEKVIFFHDIPEKLVEEKEAEAVAREIIKIDVDPISLEKPTREDEDSCVADFIKDESNMSPEEYAINELLKDEISEVLLTLTEREEQVLRLRFGLEDGTCRTLEEVGNLFGVTRERIRQIEAKALRKLRHPSRSRKLKDYLND